jgi:hypothetical protein
LQVEAHCCDEMRRQFERVCDQHPDRFDCPDCFVHYSPKFREYGLIVHDGGSSSCRMRFCPWCGTKLPESLRDEWFAEMERRGIDPWEGEVPAEFQSSAWWAARHGEPDGMLSTGDF